ncbi:hypothetical protein [Variovorax sp. W2I14]|uniref:hypothetical protein n=1 Tax=Variovorax sp. W2I14 TaxID=3042290 RepID=UPI003D1ED396
MNVRVKPVRWQGSDEAIRAVQVAFDVEETVLEAVRKAAFEQHVSTSDQIRQGAGPGDHVQAQAPAPDGLAQWGGL